MARESGDVSLSSPEPLVVKEEGDGKPGEVWLNRSSDSGGDASCTGRIQVTRKETKTAAVRTLWAFNEHSSQVLGAAQAIGASVLQCDRPLSVADSGYLPSRLKLLEEQKPSLVVLRLLKTPAVPGERQRKAARGLADLFRAQLKAGRDVLVYAPPNVPAWQMQEFADVLSALPHDCLLRWCTMGLKDERDKGTPWRLRVVSTRQFWEGRPEVEERCGHRSGDHAAVPLKPRPSDTQVHAIWSQLLFYLLVQI